MRHPSELKRRNGREEMEEENKDDKKIQSFKPFEVFSN